jgi:TonB family protein
MFKDHRGILGTFVFHGALILAIVIFGFTTPLPLPAEEGILINFGTDETGSGIFEPQFSELPDEQTVQPEESANLPAEEGQLSQDFEEAPSLEVKKPEKTAVKQEVSPKETVKVSEQPDTKPTVEEPRKVDQRALYKGRKNTDNTSEGEGITEGEGNQGGITGSPDSENYADILSQGTGGVTWSLEGRNPISLPKPDYKYQLAGTVVVRIRVDQAGKVVSAEAGVKGSNTADTRLWEAAREAALKAKFDSNPSAPVVQQGTLTYHFILQ